MDEREQELSELRDYGTRLLKEMQYPELLAMLHETITHLHDIASEYARDAEMWHGKYEESADQNVALQKRLADLPAAWESEKKELRGVIEHQSGEINALNAQFQAKLEALRSYRDDEIAAYNERVQEMLSAQSAWEQMKQAYEKEKAQLEEERQNCEILSQECRQKYNEYQTHLETNQEKLNEYETLFNDRMREQMRINEVQHKADAQIRAIREERDDWKGKYEKERYWREKFENELTTLKKCQQENAAIERMAQQPPLPSVEGQKSDVPNEDADEDGV